MNITEVKIGTIKANPSNPRIIRDDKFRKLVESIKSFPEMLKLRPIIVNDDMVVLGGNQRLRACKEVGLKVVSIIKASELTEEQQKEFMIRDNASAGDWDWEALANDWDEVALMSWGVEIPHFGEAGEDEPESKSKAEKICPHCGEVI